MTRTTLLATTAVWIIATTPAIADGMGDKKLTGLGEVGWDHTSYDLSGTSNDLNSNAFHGSGSALWTWPSKLNIQGDFSFNSDRLKADGGEQAAVDTWMIGGGVFYRDPTQGLIGGQLRYQSLDIGQHADGLNVAGRGELFLSEANLGAYLGYSTFDANGLDLDGWQLGAYGKYYVQPNLGLKLGVDYSTWDQDGSDVNDLSLNGEAEYLIPHCTTSMFAGLGYGSLDVGSSNDIDYWRFGLGLRVHFGVDGSLIERNRVEPLSGVVRSPFTF